MCDVAGLQIWVASLVCGLVEGEVTDEYQTVGYFACFVCVSELECSRPDVYDSQSDSKDEPPLFQWPSDLKTGTLL